MCEARVGQHLGIQITSPRYCIYAGRELQRNQGTKGRLIRLRPTKEINPPVVQRRTWEALANSGAFPLVK